MAESSFLPDPKWSEAAARCPGCGYSLAGIVPPTPCPECGLLYEGSQFIVHGIPTARTVMAPWRIALIPVGVLLAWLGPQTLVYIGLDVSGWVALSGLAAGIAAVVAIVRTAPRSHSGEAAQLVFVRGGVHVVPLKFDGTEARVGSFIRFSGTERVEFRPAGPFWGTLRIRAREGARLLDAGVRCPHDMREAAIRTIEELVRGRRAAAPPTSPAPSRLPAGESGPA